MILFIRAMFGVDPDRVKVLAVAVPVPRVYARERCIQWRGSGMNRDRVRRMRSILSHKNIVHVVYLNLLTVSNVCIMLMN
jgi:hypothetical protein